jgi:integrase
LDHGIWTVATEDSKGAVLEKFGRWCNWMHTEAIRSEHLLEWYEALRKEKKKNGALLHEGTAHTYLNALRSFFNWAVDENLTRENPVFKLKLGRVLHAPRRRLCTFKQRDQILAGAPNNDLRFILYCGFHAGLRKKEIIEARPEWFDLERGVLHVVQTATFTPKDKEDRTIPLTAEFKEFLKSYGLQSPFMLKPAVEQGKSLYRYDFDRPYFAYLVPLGYRWVTPHVMRHTFGSLLASSGCSIFKVAVWMGDEVRTAQKYYAHLLPVDSDIELATRPRVKEVPVPPATTPTAPSA